MYGNKFECYLQHQLGWGKRDRGSRPEMDIGPCEVITQPCFTTQQRYENMVSLSFLFLHDSMERPKRVFVKVCVLPLIHGNRGKCMALYILKLSMTIGKNGRETMRGVPQLLTIVTSDLLI